MSQRDRGGLFPVTPVTPITPARKTGRIGETRETHPSEGWMINKRLGRYDRAVFTYNYQRSDYFLRMVDANRLPTAIVARRNKRAEFSARTRVIDILMMIGTKKGVPFRELLPSFLECRYRDIFADTGTLMVQI